MNMSWIIPSTAALAAGLATYLILILPKQMERRARLSKLREFYREVSLESYKAGGVRPAPPDLAREAQRRYDVWAARDRGRHRAERFAQPEASERAEHVPEHAAEVVAA